MRRLSIVCLLLTISALLVMSPARAAGWTAQATPLDLLAGPTRTAAFLAPDGNHFAYISGHDLCLYTIAGEKGDCVTLDKDINMDLDTVRWSPDSTKLAFSEDFLITFRDSDIWLFDTETNTFKDLTLDPNRAKIKNFISNTDPNVIFTVDLAPQWSADSQAIYFIRYAFSTPKEAKPHFAKLNLSDDAVEEIGSVDSGTSFASYGFALSPDASQIVYNLYTRGTGKDGTWFLDLATKQTEFAAAPVEKTMPWTYQFSADGTLVLSIGVNGAYITTYQKPETSPIYTLPVFGGRQQQLNTDAYVFAAGWGPEGSELAYTTATVDPNDTEKQGLYITSAHGQAGDRVLSGRFIPPSPRVRTPIFWAVNNTLLLSQAPDFKLVVVQLKKS